MSELPSNWSTVTVDPQSVREIIYVIEGEQKAAVASFFKNPIGVSTGITVGAYAMQQLNMVDPETAKCTILMGIAFTILRIRNILNSYNDLSAIRETFLYLLDSLPFRISEKTALLKRLEMATEGIDYPQVNQHLLPDARRQRTSQYLVSYPIVRN